MGTTGNAETLAQALATYTEAISTSGASSATVKNRTSYCQQFIDFCKDNPSLDSGDLPTKKHLEAFASGLWRARATDTTIKSKLGESVRFVRWLHERALAPVPVIVTGDIFKEIKEQNPFRR